MASLSTSGFENIISMARVVLTGYTGNIGSRLERGLYSSGHEVIKIGRSPGAHHKFDFLSHENVLPKVGDIDFVVHTAWYSAYPHYWDAKENVVFVETSMRLLEHLFRTSPEKVRFLVAGSCAEIFSVKNPTTGLGAAKAELRRTLLSCVPCDRLAWFQIFFAYGAGEPTMKILSLIKSSSNPKMEIKDGGAYRDFISFDQVAEIFCGFINYFKPGVFQVGTGRGYRISDLVDFVEQQKLPTPMNLAEALRVASDVKIASVEPEVRSLIADEYETRRALLGWLTDCSSIKAG